MRRCLQVLPFITLILLPISATAAMDPNVVEQKIQGLGWRDDTLPYAEQPYYWLEQRVEAVYPELVKALNHTNRDVAEKSLHLLQKRPGRAALADALICIAGDTTHLIHSNAMVALCKFGEDPRARPFLQKALSDTQSFPDPALRAHFAEALGEKETAVRLLASAYEPKKYNFEKFSLVSRLEKLELPSTVEPLQRITKDPDWPVAASSFLALEKVDPKGHPLTEAQKELLNNARRGGKVGEEWYRARQQKLAALPQAEIRPYVIMMLDTDAISDALGILRIWKDRAVLPEIHSRFPEARFALAQDLMEALLTIDETDAAVKAVVSRAVESDNEFRAEEVTRGVVKADIPIERKLAVLRKLRDNLNPRWPAVVPQSLGWARTNIAPLLKPLLEEETNPCALASYAMQVARNPDQQYARGLTRALEIATAQAPGQQYWDSYPVKAILDACAKIGLSPENRVVDPLLLSTNPSVRIAAARVAAQGPPRAKALSLLNHELAWAARTEAAPALLGLPCANERERAEREQAVLALLGKPSEDYALRVLVTCGGPNTVAALKPFLDQDDVARAVHAAWVLAQLPDKEASQTGLRRLAVHAIFHHQMYQQGSGIDFPIAPELYFHQQTGWLNPRPPGQPERAGVQIPADLLKGIPLTFQEQQFLVRDYRAVIAENPRFKLFEPWAGTQQTEKTWLPLLQVVVNEDPYLSALHVKGRKVAHFSVRKKAAEALAALTGQPADYLAFGGERLDSTALPAEPYPDQNRKVAAYLLDRIEAAHLLKRPENDREWQGVESFNWLVNHLIEYEFGPELKDEILAESRRRGLFERLRTVGLSLWRP